MEISKHEVSNRRTMYIVTSTQHNIFGRMTMNSPTVSLSHAIMRFLPSFSIWTNKMPSPRFLHIHMWSCNKEILGELLFFHVTFPTTIGITCFAQLELQPAPLSSSMLYHAGIGCNNKVHTCNASIVQT